MGRKTAENFEKKVAKEISVLNHFTYKKNLEKENLNKKDIGNIYYHIKKEDLDELSSFVLRGTENYKFKTKSKDSLRMKKELMVHLFEKFQVPNFMRVLEWKNIFELTGNHFIKNTATYAWGTPFLWYICVSQGGSLFKKYTKGLLTKNETHTLINQKMTESMGEALVFSIALNAGAEYGLATKLSKTKIEKKLYEQIFKSNMHNGIQNFEAEREATAKKVSELINVIRQLARLTTKESVSEINDILDYVFMRMSNDAEYTMSGKGYTMESLKKATLDWHHDLRRKKLSVEFVDKRWSGFGFKDSVYVMETEEGIEMTVEFNEILDGATLNREGNTQHHCVFSYLGQCTRGTTSIVRMFNPKNGKSMVTIEVSKGIYGFTIVQARRFANAKPKVMEKKFITNWAREHGISIAAYVF